MPVPQTSAAVASLDPRQQEVWEQRRMSKRAEKTLSPTAATPAASDISGGPRTVLGGSASGRGGAEGRRDSAEVAEGMKTI